MISPDRIRIWVRERVRPQRFDHIERVAKLSASLARTWKTNEDVAIVVGLLHDCARDMTVDELKEQAAAFRIPITDIEKRAPVLLHGPVGAALIESQLGVGDHHILDAVRFHTTGRSGMSIVEKILFVADYAEPGRDFPGVERVRSLMHVDLDGAIRAALDQTVAYLVTRGRLLHPLTVEARNAMYLMVESGVDQESNSRHP